MTYSQVLYTKKYRTELIKYLEEIEKNSEYIPSMLSIELLEVMALYKDLYLIFESENLINVFYEVKEKKHFRFIFEIPKIDYDFLTDAKSIVVIFSKETENYPNEESEETIIENEKIVSLEGGDLKKIRKKVNSFNTNHPNIIIEEFNPEIHQKNIMVEFLEKWGQMYEEKSKSPYLNLDLNYFKYIYDNNGDIKGLIAKDNDEIIGFTFYLLSPLKKQGIGLAKKNFYKYKGLNEFLTLKRCEILLKKHNIKYTNLGVSKDEGILEFKRKLGCAKSILYTLFIKKDDVQPDYFWEDDHYMD